MRINKNEHVQCPRCLKVSTLGEWNDLTYAQCTNREMKRAFTELMNDKAFLLKSDTFYICPKCNDWNRGCQLKIVDTDNNYLKKLGGKSVILS